MQTFEEYLKEQKVSINPENWVDGGLEVDLISDTEFRIPAYDETFTISMDHIPDEESDGKFAMTIGKVSDSTGREMITLSKMDSDDLWDAFEGEISEESEYRQDKDPRIAAAKVLANIW